MRLFQLKSQDKVNASFYKLLCYFIIYSFLGWCGEVIYKFSETGRFINRGFLFGPILPIYGFGVVIVIVCLTPIKKKLILLFTSSIVLTTTLEYITGYILELLFDTKWWDYSHVPFNINGYICLEASLIWGFGCIIIMYLVHPIVELFVTWLSKKLVIVFHLVFFILLAIDIIFSVSTLLFNQTPISDNEIDYTMSKKIIRQDESDR